MNELVFQDPELNDESKNANTGVSPGALIREAREASGVHVDVLASALKITVDRLEALESDNYAALPDMVFSRALASSACRILKLDPACVLALMPKNQAHSFSAGRPDINATFKDGTENQGRQFLRQFTRPVGVAVMVLLVGAGVLFFMPERAGGPNGIATAPEQSLAAAQVNENSALTQLMPTTQSLERLTPIAPNVLVTDHAKDKQTPDMLTIGATDETGAPSMAMDGLLEFRAREVTWVQVRDATKAVVFERTLTKGASASATGMLPLSVVVGRADSTDVFVRGTPFVLTSVAKENVARFEVK